MIPGRILVGNGDGTYLLKFVGDVRLSLGAAFDEFLDRLFRDRNLRSVLVDLSRTDAIDSTSLGALARLSLQAQKRLGCMPTLVSTQPDINRLLITMGFDDIFHVVHEPLKDTRQLGELPKSDLAACELRRRVLAAHRHLMALNESNREEFEDLVATLEAAE
ncbi:MAG: STAS domain-containing protein [Gammaproteobacteria bacterium]|nr:STAS domain-containing protein [Gammaproteobacteria bacterium]